MEQGVEDDNDGDADEEHEESDEGEVEEGVSSQGQECCSQAKHRLAWRHHASGIQARVRIGQLPARNSCNCDDCGP